MNVVKINQIKIGTGQPLALIAGPCVIESEKIAFETAETIKRIAEELDVPTFFKSSYTKANRQSVTSFTGPGLTEGLKILAKIKAEFDLPILTDIHTPKKLNRWRKWRTSFKYRLFYAGKRTSSWRPRKPASR